MPDTGREYPRWGEDPSFGGPGSAGPAEGSNEPTGGVGYGPFNFDSYSFGNPLWKAIEQMKGGKFRLQGVLGNIYGAGNQGMFDGVQNIDRAFMESLLGVANPTQTRFIQRLFSTMDGTRGGGGADGGGADGGVAATGGTSTASGGISLPNVKVDRADPFSGELGGYLQALIQNLMDNPGIDPEVLAHMRTQARDTNATAERNQITRRGEDFAARGLFGSGLQGREIRGIEDASTQNLNNALNQIDFTNAQAIQRSVDQTIAAMGAAISREGGLNSVNLQEARLQLDKAISEIQLQISDMVARGNLDIAQGQLALEAAVQQIMIQLGILGNYFG